MNDRYRWVLPLIMAFVVTLGLASCAGGSGAHEEGEGEAGPAEAAGEHAMSEGVTAEREGEHASREGEGEHSSQEAEGEHREGGGAREGGEHGGEGGHDEEGEESGVYISASETWDVVRRGARLVLSFDSDTNAFVGSVENTTEQQLCAIRVEIHLSTGTELGPTDRVDLPAGQTTSITLSTEGEAFESFTAHPEMSPCGDG